MKQYTVTKFLVKLINFYNWTYKIGWWFIKLYKSFYKDKLLHRLDYKYLFNIGIWLTTFKLWGSN